MTFIGGWINCSSARSVMFTIGAGQVWVGEDCECVSGGKYRGQWSCEKMRMWNKEQILFPWQVVACWTTEPCTVNEMRWHEPLKESYLSIQEYIGRIQRVKPELHMPFNYSIQVREIQQAVPALGRHRNTPLMQPPDPSAMQ